MRVSYIPLKGLVDALGAPGQLLGSASRPACNRDHDLDIGRACSTTAISEHLALDNATLPDRAFEANFK